jgi:hypothetical protein
MGRRRRLGSSAVSDRRAQAVLVLFSLVLCLTVAGGVWLWHQQQAINRVQMIASANRCADLGKLASIPVPVPIAGNPSREFAAAEETIWRQRAHQLGCKIGSP